MDEVAERLLSEGDSSLVQTLFTVWAEQGLAAKEFDLAQLCFDIDYYVRALDRMTLITAFPEHEVHVFGETQWATAPGARSWSELLQDYSNIVVHPAVSYAQSFDILRQTKICLNSSPFFRDGTHERVFAGMACGCAVLTSRSRYLEEQFFEEEELLFYDFDLLEIAEARVEELLADERRRVILAHRGAQKVYHDHTWDQRAETLLEELPGMLDRLSVDPRT
jgi:spore maturation protein CgeB